MNAKKLPKIVVAFFFGVVLSKILDQNTAPLPNLLNKKDERKAAPADPSSPLEATGTATDTSTGVEKAGGDAETKKESDSGDTPKNADASLVDGADTAAVEDTKAGTTETGVDSGDGEPANVGEAPGKESGAVKNDKKGDEAQSGAITVTRGSSSPTAQAPDNKSDESHGGETSQSPVTTNEPTEVCPPDVCPATDMVEYENEGGETESIHYRDLLWDLDGMNPASSQVDMEWTNQ